MKRSKLNKLVPGVQLKIIGNSCFHSNNIGDILTFRKLNEQNKICVKENTSYFNFNDIEIISVTIGDLTEELKIEQNILIDVKNNISNIEAKIAYMDDNSVFKFDEKEYQAYTILLALDDTGLSTFERAKKIASIFN